MKTQMEWMSTKSFFKDLVIDTPEAAARLAELFEENRMYSRWE